MNRINSFIRPEGFALVADEQKGVKGKVRRINFMGSYNELEIDISGHTIVVNANNHFSKNGDIVYLALKEWTIGRNISK